ncbi:MAG: 3D-(3,5/4)-trihydroxycyclohexane-1,2-dione acylhydrolase (decyclizing) [Candidatus Melainabacteria bacterium]|nr:3D-(3,5/4)-trihydroxycyclohexane-1,2-dione acylhydrolase (decyclizing) [Candidatus Melainabacteria bacterium]
MAQALIKFLKNQYVQRDDITQPFFAGCFGIFGHGNLAGVGQALQENPDFTYYQSRNEQAMVHAAVAFARAKNRLQTLVCTSSIGPGATNMVTGAALATINRLPVLLLPGDIFARRDVAPVLQQLESEHSQDVSVNDCFKPVSRYWDRINRPEQLLTALPEAMRALTSPCETGAVTICLPQDVQAEAYDYPENFFEKRVWYIPRLRADAQSIQDAAHLIKSSKQPIIVSGGGTIYSEACQALAEFADAAGIPVVESQAGKGSLHFEHPLSLGAMGVTGTRGANILAREADLVIGVGTRYSDFTTASKSAFQNPDVKFININVMDFDCHKHNALALVGDARATLDELLPLVRTRGNRDECAPANNRDECTPSNGRDKFVARVQEYRDDWDTIVESIYNPQDQQPDSPISQGEVVGLLNELSAPTDVVVCAAGSLPGDLHKLWRSRDPKGYHVEYGYSCMGYEIAAGLGIKMASPERGVYVMVGDGSYLMMAQEITTAVQEKIKMTILLLDNHGYGSIGSLSKSLGSAGFGTSYRFRSEDGQLNGEFLPIDFAANATSLGAKVFTANTRNELIKAFTEAKPEPGVTVIVISISSDKKVGGYETWWDVPVAQVSSMQAVQQASKDYQASRKKQVPYFQPHQARLEKKKVEEAAVK